MIKLATILLAIVLIVAGMIVFPMPIPLGAIMMVTGVVLLITVSPSVAARIKLFRHHHGRINDFIQKAEARLPDRLKEILKRTAP